MNLYEQKIHIIKEFTEYDIMINKSFRDLLCLEGLLIGVMGNYSSLITSTVPSS